MRIKYKHTKNLPHHHRKEQKSCGYITPHPIIHRDAASNPVHIRRRGTPRLYSSRSPRAVHKTCQTRVETRRAASPSTTPHCAYTPPRSILFRVNIYSSAPAYSVNFCKPFMPPFPRLSRKRPKREEKETKKRGETKERQRRDG